MKKLSFILYFMVFTSSVYAQENCGGIPPLGSVEDTPASCINESVSSIDVKINFHIYTERTDPDCYSLATLDQCIFILNSYFSGTGFTFFYNRCEVVYDPDTEKWNGRAEVCEIFNGHSLSEDGITMHLLSQKVQPRDAINRACSIPGKEVIVSSIRGFDDDGNFKGVPRLLSSTAAHEIGHALGLYHTHHNEGPERFTDCDGNEEWRMSLGRGDYVPDTPRDPQGISRLQNNCTYNLPVYNSQIPPYVQEFLDGVDNNDNGESDETVVIVRDNNINGQQESVTFEVPPFEFVEDPMTSNLMSYYAEGCRKEITHCQAIRMHELKPENISGQSNLCCGDGIILADGSNVDDLIIQLNSQGYTFDPNANSYDLAEVAQDIKIEGSFTVNKFLVLPRLVNIYMGTNAEIVVSPNVLFRKDGGFIAACDEEFRTVRVENNATILLEKVDIRGAEVGLVFSGGSGIVNGGAIYNCDIGIRMSSALNVTIRDMYIDVYSQGVLAYRNSNFILEGNVFDITSPLKNGVISSHSQGTIANNKIRSESVSVKTNFGNYDIDKNFISAGNDICGPIYGFSPTSPGPLIFPGGPCSSGIISTHMVSSDNTISNNEVYGYDSRYGILNTNSHKGIRIERNLVSGNCTEGISINGGSEVQLIANRIEGQSDFGIHALNATASNFECNEIEAMNFGLHIDANSPTENIATNEFKEGAETDFFTRSSIDVQSLKGNHGWNYTEAAPNVNVEFNYFEVDSLRPVSNPDQLFRPIGEPEEECDLTPGPKRHRPKINCWYPAELAQMKNEGRQKFWISTYQYLRQHLGDSDPASWPAALWNDEPELISLLSADISFSQRTATYSTAVSTISESLPDSPIVNEADYLANINQLKVLKTNHDLHVANLIAAQTASLVALQPQDDIAALWIETYLYYLKSYDIAQLSESDIERITELAILCPEDYGAMVHTAQSILMAYDLDYVPYNHPCEERIEQRESENLDYVSEIQVFPNPATDQVTIQWLETLSTEIRLLSSEGKEILHQSIEGKSIDLNTANVLPGLYIIEVSQAYNYKEIFKIVIIK